MIFSFFYTHTHTHKLEAHGPHPSPVKHFKSINTYSQSYDYSFLITWNITLFLPAFQGNASFLEKHP